MPVIKDLWPSVMEEITRLRIDEPERVLSLAQKRQRRSHLAPDGRLNIIACDHPARGVVKVADKPLCMANRHDYLSRIVKILNADAADGVMGSMDILEELLLLDYVSSKTGGKSFLVNKVLIASLNRGGLAGSSWELDDPLTGATPESCKQWNLDGAKILLRIDYKDPNSVKTIGYAADAISRLSRLNLPTFLEPLPVVSSPSGQLTVNKDAVAMQKIVGIASALGETSSYLWLKLPICQNFKDVAAATTLPILLLGGEAADLKALTGQIEDALVSGHNVRGTMIGRNVLFPKEKDPVSIAKRINDIVHNPKLNTSHL